MCFSVLIIGSLLWDNGRRRTWRQSRLRLEERTFVKVPIRYGRCSRSRGNTFTMTFGADDELGQGVLVPCAAPIRDVASLIVEAEALWGAEQHNPDEHSIGTDWGCVGALFCADEALADYSTEWSKHFRSRANSIIPPVDANGILRIPWPAITGEGKLADTKGILSTATRPEQQQPTPTEIADAWLTQSAEHEQYFFKNVQHGIRTPEDGLIWEQIEKKAPSWLNNPAYTEPVARLREEAANAV